METNGLFVDGISEFIIRNEKFNDDSEYLFFYNSLSVIPKKGDILLDYTKQYKHFRWVVTDIEWIIVSSGISITIWVKPHKYSLFYMVKNRLEFLCLMKISPFLYNIFHISKD